MFLCFGLLLLLLLLAATWAVRAEDVFITAEYFTMDSSFSNMGESTTPPRFPEDVLSLPHALFSTNANANASPKIGISLSGGGSRSFVSSIAQLGALHSLHLLSKTTHLSSVSGGTWASAVLSYHDQTKFTLEDLLGEYTPPAKLTLNKLRERIPRTSARGFPVRRNMVLILVDELSRSKLEDVWTKAIHRTFLQPAGITLGAMPTLNRNTAAAILARNPALINSLDFRFPRPGLPFPIFNIAMLGPSEDVDAGSKQYTRKYVMMHATPLYVGFPRQQNLTYGNNVKELRLGGLMEPIGFGALQQQGGGGAATCKAGRCRLRRADPMFSIANATGASSWAPGSFLVAYQQPAELMRLQNILLTTNYYSPLFSHGEESREVFVGDGENVENQGLLALLQRRARVVCMFVNTATVLTSTRHESMLFVRIGRDIDASFAALFGFFSASTRSAEDYSRDQVFPRADLLRVMHALQDSVQRGRGAVAAFDLETVENEWWGIPAKHKVHVVVNYLARAFEWEDALPPSAREEVRVEHDRRPEALPVNGTFKRFPHLPVTQIHLTTELSNALSSLSHWVVRRNEQIYRHALERVGRTATTTSATLQAAMA